ncbi:hypothetical protein IVB04_06715 [Bradyrhizobium sp. 169]|nr:hypothetical protein [Bradyrhizobium sp. 169]
MTLVKKAEVGSGQRAGVPTDMAEKLKAHDRAVQEGITYDRDELISLPSSLPLLRTLEKKFSQPTISKNSRMKLIIDKQPEGSRLAEPRGRSGDGLLAGRRSGLQYQHGVGLTRRGNLALLGKSDYGGCIVIPVNGRRGRDIRQVAAKTASTKRLTRTTMKIDFRSSGYQFFAAGYLLARVVL